MKNTQLFSCYCFYLVVGSAHSQSYKSEFGFKSENDSYLAQGSDRYYTNGLFINYRRAFDQTKLKAGLEKKIYEISIGQKIYNPISGYAPNPSTQDRTICRLLICRGSS